MPSRAAEVNGLLRAMPGIAFDEDRLAPHRGPALWLAARALRYLHPKGLDFRWQTLPIYHRAKFGSPGRTPNDLELVVEE